MFVWIFTNIYSNIKKLDLQYNYVKLQVLSIKYIYSNIKKLDLRYNYVKLQVLSI